ncbi:MAG TPA: DUF5777 family beta-barrel protein [Bacteroidia bacterium]|jgi:hypothetical protein|nr:DUF5777 family beta-barrel protein [Bacteroidia bacterium]
MKKIIALLLVLCSCGLYAQVDPMQAMADSMAKADSLAALKHDYVHASFKGTRLINFPTLETVGKNCLDFRIQHRFGEFSSGSYNAWGLDGGACIRLSLDYGINDWLAVGIGRTSIDKLADASFKAKILRQKTDNSIPVTVTWSSGINYTFMKDNAGIAAGYDKYHYPLDRISYTNCLIIGRKFNNRLSIEFNGFWVHYNIVDHYTDKNDIFAAGLSARYKVTNHMAITAEYAHRLNKYSDLYDTYHDPFGIGIDLETGGHVFQMHFTNQFGMNEAEYIPYTTSDWLATNSKGMWAPGFRLGFNISRVFVLSKEGNGW